MKSDLQLDCELEIESAPKKNLIEEISGRTLVIVNVSGIPGMVIVTMVQLKPGKWKK